MPLLVVEKYLSFSMVENILASLDLLQQKKRAEDSSYEAYNWW